MSGQVTALNKTYVRWPAHFKTATAEGTDFVRCVALFYISLEPRERFYSKARKVSNAAAKKHIQGTAPI